MILEPAVPTPGGGTVEEGRESKAERGEVGGGGRAGVVGPSPGWGVRQARVVSGEPSPFGGWSQRREVGAGLEALAAGIWGSGQGTSVAEGETRPDCGSYLESGQHGFSDDLSVGEGEKSG